VWESSDYKFSQIRFCCDRRTEASATFGCFYYGFSNDRMRMTKNQRAPRADIVNVLIPIDIHDAGALAQTDEWRVSADGTEGADRGIDSSGDELLGSLLQFAGLLGLTRHDFDAKILYQRIYGNFILSQYWCNIQALVSIQYTPF
jgi:hypothetical protein